MLAENFAAKAKANADFVVAALERLGREALNGTMGVPAVSLHVANQLTMEGIELALKALILARGSKPPASHKVACLYESLDVSDKNFVDELVESAVLESATGAVPFGLPNVSSAALRNTSSLGEGDPAAGYAGMNAEAFFTLLDDQWHSQNSQYLGADRSFELQGVLRISSRFLAGGILVCLGLPGENWQRCGARFAVTTVSVPTDSEDRARPRRETSALRSMRGVEPR